MARIKVNVYANLREYTGGAPSVDVDVEPGQTIADVLAHLKIPSDQTRIIFVNHRHAALDYALRGDERIDLFSAIGGG